MSNLEDSKDPQRELPISLQGIETILLYLKEGDKKPSSIRNISSNTELSMRVVKNILLQLEKFNQVERIVEKNNILPKWRITKFGKKVIKEASGIEENIQFPSREDELIHGITLPFDLKELKDLSREKHDSIINELDGIQSELSKLLGPILDINNPVFEDLQSFIIKRIKYLKTKVSNMPINPIASYSMKKVGEKQKKLSTKEERFLFFEILFYNSIILNELKRISDFNTNLTRYIENDAISNAYTLAKDLREEIRLLSSLIYQRESININSHNLTEDDFKNLLQDKVETQLLDNIIQIPMKDEMRTERIKEIVLKFLAMVDRGEKLFNGHSYELYENLPLFALYQLILDENPKLNFTIEELEIVINSLADDGYIPGIKIIQEDEDHFLKIVQLKAHDISEDEIKIISLASKLQKFTLADMIKATNWTKEKILEILNNMTKHGILKYSKSFLHGESWYIISEKSI